MTEVTLIRNIAYAPAEPAESLGHLLDLYLPSGDASPWPLIVWSSGSAWLSDDGKSGAAAIAEVFNPRGYAVAGVSVRSSTQAIFPAQVFDIKAAIRWLRAHHTDHRLDPDRFAGMGDSSGGWVASMAAVTGGVAELEGTLGTTGVSSRVQACVTFFGPTDFLQMNAQRPHGADFDHDGTDSPEARLVGCAIQTCPAAVARANPLTYVDGDIPPMLLLHGQADPLVPHGQSEILYAALKSRGVDAQFISVPGAGHSMTDVMDPARSGPTWDTVDAFLRRVLRIPG